MKEWSGQVAEISKLYTEYMPEDGKLVGWGGENLLGRGLHPRSFAILLEVGYRREWCLWGDFGRFGAAVTWSTASWEDSRGQGAQVGTSFGCLALFSLLCFLSGIGNYV